MPTLSELGNTLEVKRGELAAIFDSHKTADTDPNTGNPVFDDTTPIKEINDRAAELKTLQEQFVAAQSVDSAYQANAAAIKAAHEFQRGFQFGNHPKGGPEEPGTGGLKAFTDAFTGSPGYKSFHAGNRNGNGFSMEYEGSVKTLFSEAGGGYVPYPAQQPYLILSPQRRLVVADLIPQDDTDAAIIIYMRETTFTNNAAAVAEGGSKPESALQYTRISVPMTKIATTLPVTDEQMMDVPQIEAVLRNRLGFMVQLEEERELLSGSGSSPEMTGFLNTSGVLTQAKGSDDNFTAAFKAIVKVNSTTGFANATAYVYNPNDWQILRTTKDTLGRFILGNPDQPGPAVLWGLPVVQTIAQPSGTALTGDFKMYSHIDRKLGLRVDAGYVNDDFKRNQMTLRAEERLALEIYRPSAFCALTGIA